MAEIWNLNQYSNSVALIDERGQSLTYGALETESKKLAEKISRRSLVFILCNNEIGSVLGYVAFLNNRIVPLLLNAHLDRDLTRRLIEIYEPEYLWLPKTRADEFSNFECICETYGYTLLKNCATKNYSIYEELALLLTTSGSTGSPKFVRQSYENIRANTAAIIEYLKIDSTARPLVSLPMNYTYGLSIINTNLAAGATVLLTDKSIMQKEFWQFFKEQQATLLAGVPYTYEMLDKLRFYRMKLPSLKTLIQAGGKILPELHEKFARYAEEQGKEFFVMYGSCEATARMGYLPPKDSLRKKGAMGIAIPGGKFYLVDDNGETINKTFTAGELVYAGKNVTLGYAECRADLSKTDERGGVLFTGDIAEFDDEGFFTIIGRKKRFLKIYGNRVNLDEVERLIKDGLQIEVATDGVDDKLYIFVTDNAVVDTVKNFIATKTKLNPVAFFVKVIENIPRNDAGKILYKELKKFIVNKE